MIGDLIGKSPRAVAVCPHGAPLSIPRLSRFLLISILALVVSVPSMLLQANRASAATGTLIDRATLQELRKASSIMLMIVPYPTFFMMALDEAQLRKVSCQYEITAGPTFDEVLNILGDTMIEYKIGPKPNADLRVGIVFKTNGKMVREFYFNDSGGSFNLLGFSGDHATRALAGLPSRLRDLIKRPAVVLVQDQLSRCPHP